MPDTAGKGTSTHCLEIAAATDLLYPDADLYPDARSCSEYRFPTRMGFASRHVIPQSADQYCYGVLQSPASERVPNRVRLQLHATINLHVTRFCLVITPCLVIGVPVRAANDMRQYRLGIYRHLNVSHP